MRRTTFPKSKMNYFESFGQQRTWAPLAQGVAVGSVFSLFARDSRGSSPRAAQKTKSGNQHLALNCKRGSRRERRKDHKLSYLS